MDSLANIEFEPVALRSGKRAETRIARTLAICYFHGAMTRGDEPLSNAQRIALEWIRVAEGDGARIRENDIYPLLRRWIHASSPTEILEIGAGQGICSDKIDLDGRRYTGIEPSPLLVERAQELYRAENRRFVLGSAYNLPFPDGAFDAVFSVSVWHLLSDLQDAAEEMSRVLKADGRFLMITANPAAYSLWKELYATTTTEGRRLEGTVQLPDRSVLHEVLYLHTLDEILGSLRDADLEVEETETFRPSAGGQQSFISIRGKKDSKDRRD
jgi:SAM-dependent methyltransferase